MKINDSETIIKPKTTPRNFLKMLSSTGEGPLVAGVSSGSAALRTAEEIDRAEGPAELESRGKGAVT
jgi:hypothetical protein